MDVVSVGFKDRLPLKNRRTMESPTSRSGTAKNEQRSSHSENGRRLLTPNSRVATEQEPQCQATGVAQKNACRVEVVAEGSQ